jgi:peptide/nickel transport system permease protein
MLKYVTWRIVSLVTILIAVAIVAFALGAVLELRSNAAEYVLEAGAADPEAVAAVESQLGLDQPLYERFGSWFRDAVQGDFGNSLVNPRVSVMTLIGERIGPTLSIVALSLLISSVFGITFGILSAIRPGRFADRGLSLLSAVLMSVPNFAIGLLLMGFFAVKLGWFDPTGYRSPGEDGVLAWLKSITLPAIALALPTIAIIQRQLRSSMTAALQSSYVLAARARGVPSRTVVRRHAMRNAMIPTVTVIGFYAAAAIGITTAVELVFNIPGMGLLMVDSIIRRDLTVVQGCLVIAAVIVCVINLLVDISYAWLDPKVTVR